MRKLAVSAVLIGIAIGSGCTKKPEAGSGSTAGGKTGQQATVTLKDGTGFAGMVASSSTSSITLTAPNGESRTYPMSQVASIQYGSGQTDTVYAPAAATPPADTASAPGAAANNLPPANLPPANPPVENAPPAAAPPIGAAPVRSHAVSNVPPPTSYPPPGPAQTMARPEQAPLVRQPAQTVPVAMDRTVPAGARLVVRNNETIDSQTAAPGQTYSAVVEQSVTDTTGRVVIPRGSPATLVVRSASGQGRMQGQSELALDIDAVSVGGKRYRVETSDVVQRGAPGLGENSRTGKFVGGGTALGALLGAVAGGGRGAAIGALSGAAAGTATQTVTRGHGVRVPAETMMTFRLEAPVRVREIR